MKRINIAIILLLFSVLVCITEFIFVNNSADIIMEKIEKSRELYKIGKREEAMKFALDAEEIWEEKVSRIDMLLYHDYVDDITRDISNLKIYIEEGDSTGLYSTCADTLNRIKSLKKSELPTLENII